MTPYEPSFAKDLYAERVAKAGAERLARKLAIDPEKSTERSREGRGVSPLLAWAEGIALVRRLA
jgi:hypothetical protein